MINYFHKPLILLNTEWAGTIALLQAEVYLPTLFPQVLEVIQSDQLLYVLRETTNSLGWQEGQA